MSDGIVFSGREILRRNEFVSGDFIVIGARRDYAFYVTNLRTGGVGLIPSHEEGNSIPRETVECLGLRFVDFLSASSQIGSQPDSTYLVPEYFNVDAIAVMQMLSDCCLGSVEKTPETFRRWIHDVGVPKNYCLCDFVPMEEMSAGSCVIFPHKQIVAVNYEMRRRINPHYLVVGSCPDGNLVVLDIRRSVPSIGYVSIEEAGDEESWDDYYVLVSQTLGSYTWNEHDTVIEQLFPNGQRGTGVDVKSLGPKLNMQNVFGCYLSSHVRKIRHGRFFPTYTSSIDDYANMYRALYTRLLRYKSMRPNCLIEVRIYDGENANEADKKYAETDYTQRRWPIKAEEFYTYDAFGSSDIQDLL